MNKYLKAQPKAKSAILQSMQLANQVRVIEQEFLPDGVASQCALKVYAFERQLIRIVTYYPAVSCEQR